MTVAESDKDHQARARPPELEDWLNHTVYHPISHQLALALRHTPVSPNIVSAMGGLAVAMAALSYGFLPYPVSVFAGFLLHAAWHVLDGADGDLARLTDRVSAVGEFVDGLFDYLGHIAMYLVLAVLVAPQLGLWTLPLIIAAALGRAAQQNFFETVRRSYEYWVYGRAWLGTTTPAHGENKGNSTAQRLVRSYLRGAGSMLPEVATLNGLSDAGSTDARKASIREIVVERRVPLLTELAPFGSNLRTLALGLAMLVQLPVLYLLYEAVALNLALAVVIGRKRRLLRSIIETVEPAQPSSTVR